jgi:O-antigen/teichoic acid export membrane protein
MLERLRNGPNGSLSIRFGVTAADQCLSSLSNFAVGLAAARVAGAAGLGVYALVYAVWLVLASMHRSLITDPMAIENDLHQPDAARRVRAGLAAELWLGLAAAVGFAVTGVVMLAVGQHQFGLGFLCLSPWLPCLLAQDYWRWVGFMSAKPKKSLVNDIVFDAIQATVFVLLLVAGVHTSMVAVWAWGVGAAGGALFGLFQFKVRPSLRGGVELLVRRWRLSRWLVAGNLTSTATNQSTAVLTGAFLGPTGIGGLKAATSLMAGPALVLVQATGSIGLPEASRALHERGWPGLRRVERLVTAVGVIGVALIATIIFCFGHWILVNVYGPSFGQYAGAANVLAVAGIVTSTSLGAILCLKATRKGHLILPATTAAVGVSIVTAVLLIPPYGVMGAAVATVIPSSFRTAGLLVSHRAWSRKSAERMYRELQEESAPLPARGAVAPQPLSPAEPTPAGSLER